ncbi:unnamed protein product [Ceratitis capitata]|uniref:(Mediterranean fruit fly) hypothetical protein n=1 Tax=Ceratitis capitata TaxID=7213 RepID=A0A811VDX0_CERCA|nr:unnamed protein product [Ceratitis capitata]
MSKEIKIKYKDQLTVVGTPYKIFRLMHVDYSFMVSFFNSPILNCSWINVNDDFTIKCRGKQPILLRQSKFYCFGYGLYYLADLLALCMDQQDSLTKIASQGSFSVVHLSYIPPLKAAQAGLNHGMYVCSPSQVASAFTSSRDKLNEIKGWLPLNVQQQYARQQQQEACSSD